MFNNGLSLEVVVFSGCTGVNQVAQGGGIVGITSSTVQGGDDGSPTMDNVGPSLLFWDEKSGKILFSPWLQDCGNG